MAVVLGMEMVSERADVRGEGRERRMGGKPVQDMAFEMESG
jgi:hypothetical protein